MKALKVVFEPDEDGWWSVSIPELKGVRSDGRTLVEARRKIRQALASAEDLGWNDEKANAAKFVEDVRLPDAIAALLHRRAEALADLAAASRLVEDTTAQVIRALTSAGRSLRDVAGLLGLSHGRIHQLLLTNDNAWGSDGPPVDRRVATPRQRRPAATYSEPLEARGYTAADKGVSYKIGRPVTIAAKAKRSRAARSSRPKR